MPQQHRRRAPEEEKHARPCSVQPPDPCDGDPHGHSLLLRSIARSRRTERSEAVIGPAALGQRGSGAACQAHGVQSRRLRITPACIGGAGPGAALTVAPTRTGCAVCGRSCRHVALPSGDPKSSTNVSRWAVDLQQPPATCGTQQQRERAALPSRTRRTHTRTDALQQGSRRQPDTPEQEQEPEQHGWRCTHQQQRSVFFCVVGRPGRAVRRRGGGGGGGGVHQGRHVVVARVGGRARGGELAPAHAALPASVASQYVLTRTDVT
jgi:hypothetical protein